MKKILYLITQTEIGGAQGYVYDLACSLKNDYNIIVAGGEQGAKGKIAKKLIEKEIKFIEIPDLVRSVSFVKDFLALIDIIQLIKKEDPDIIHLNSSKISILGSIAASICHKSGVPNYVVYTAHGWVFNEPISKLKKSFYRYAEKFTSKFKDKIICVSEFDRQTAIKESIAPKEKLITIHNGINKINFLSRDLSVVELSKIFPFPLKDKGEDDIFIGSIGNLYPTKGYEYLIETIHILSYNYKISVKAMIIGGGKEKKHLQNLINQYKLKNKIILTDRVDRAKVLLKAFDIYVCSSLKEGLSYTIIEAMQAGLPIVATDVGGNPELIEDNKTGLLVKSKNAKQIAEAIYKLLRDNKLRSDLGKNAKEKAEKEFTLETMINKTKSLY